MRRSFFSTGPFLCAFLALHSVGARGQAQEPGASPAIERQISGRATPCLRLRTGASPDRSILECLDPGTRLQVVGEISNWSQVRLADGTEGWVDSSYLEAPPASSALPPAAAPAQAAQPADDLRGQIAALEGQLDAMTALRTTTEERLRKTVAAAEEAQIEAGRLGQRVRELEQERAGSDREEQLATELTAGQARIAELEQALSTAESQLLRAAGLNAEQERRIEALDAALAAGRTGEAELRQALAAADERWRAAKEARDRQAGEIAELQAALASARDREAELGQAQAGFEARLRAAEETGDLQAQRIAELEAAPPPDSPRRAELRQELKQARARLREAERTNSTQTERIEELTDQLAAAEGRLAATRAAARPAARPEPPPEPKPEPAPAEPVQVRTPIVSAPEQPAVSVRQPLAPTAEAAPVSPEEAPAEPPRSATEAAIDTVRAWAAAWSDQRVDDYLSYYAASFRPVGGLDRGAWEAQRSERLSRPSYIRVTISSLRAEPTADGTVRATFRQDYESDTFADSVTKVLTLAEEGGTWRIVAEEASP